MVINLNSAVESTMDVYCADFSGLVSDSLSYRTDDMPSIENQQKDLKNQHVSHPHDDLTAEFRIKNKKHRLEGECNLEHYVIKKLKTEQEINFDLLNNLGSSNNQSTLSGYILNNFFSPANSNLLIHDKNKTMMNSELTEENLHDYLNISPDDAYDELFNTAQV